MAEPHPDPTHPPRPPSHPDPVAAAGFGPPAPPTAAPRDDDDDHVSTGKGVKETIESILIAFILAFVFRAFVVEAFVIPTGSMATTLLGAHMRFTCPECGYVYDVGYQAEQRGDDLIIPDRYKGTAKTWCPNCKYAVESDEPPIRYGDRILVLKYQYIPWLPPRGPHRWDVVVFKNPTDQAGNYSQNYIKRLVGLPGEELMILDGDVYVRTGPGDYDWTVQTKPAHAQDALWRVVYDHDHRPLDKDRSDGWAVPWVPGHGSGWNAHAQPADRDVRAFDFDNPTGEGSLAFDAGKDERYFTDWLAYDTSMYGGRGIYPIFRVSDLKLAFTYRRAAGDGPLRARMTKHGHEFVLEVTPAGLRLTHRPDAAAPPADIPAVAPLAAADLAGPLRIEFENVDHRVTVRANDRVVFRTTPEQYRPDVKELLNRYHTHADRQFPAPSVSIEAERQKAQLSHVGLWRDVYYTPEDGRRNQLDHARPDKPVKLNAADPAASVEDEYFVMGDNSAASSDARFWRDRIDLPDEGLSVDAGRVPARFMLGRAFFVYWPAGYKPFKNAPALVPNFGDMRLIR